MSQTQPAVARTDSINSQDPNLHAEKKPKSRRPGNTAFRQQRLKAWQPILTPKTVLPLFFAIGIIFAPIGGALLYASAKTQEIIIDYTTCGTDAPYGTFGNMSSSLISASFKNDSLTTESATWSRNNITYSYGPGADVPNTIQCSIQFTVPEAMGHPILFYYQLTNFYQNHRRYVKSLDSAQLTGTALNNDTISSSSCTPLTTNGSGFAYYPCGIIANSQFNDTFYNPVLLNPPDQQSNWTYLMDNNTNIAWESDKKLYGNTSYTWDQVAPPPNWMTRYPNGYTAEHPPPDLGNDEAFMVWMRTAGLPTFSKLYQRNNTVDLWEGRYQIDVNDNFNVSMFGGTKSILISTRTVMGGKNPFLGIAYVVVGGICLVLGTVFTVTYLVKPRKLGDHTYLSWNNEAPTTATTSGAQAQNPSNLTGREVRPDVA